MNATGAALTKYLRTLATAQINDVGTDRQLLEQFVTRREQTAFAALVRRHGSMVLGVCRRVLGHEQDAEDAFQAVFLVLAKNAGSIRKHESLSCWLHGVAYHVADKLRTKEARRIIHERKAAVPLPIDPAEDAAWREIRCLLDSELARLPENYRGPLVLCYLEGRTQDEAARQLEWSLSTLRRRLEQARRLLARRLKRRGLTLSAALTAPVLIENAAAAAVPPLLAAGTIRAGLALANGQSIGAAASASIAVLVESGGQALLTSKVKWAFALLLAVCVAAGGMMTYQTPPTKSTAPPPPPTRSAVKEDRIEIKGRVLGPDGKPFAGAHLLLLPSSNPKKADGPARATTDKDGRFRFTVDSADFGPQGNAKIVATAKGLGFDWIDMDAKRKSEEITLRLVADDAPIIGRVLDLEGQPIAGATVQVRVVTKRADDKDLTDFVQKLEKYLKEGTPGFPNEYFQPGPFSVARDQFQWKRFRPTGLDVPATATTDKDGRFRLTGFGRERILEIAIHGSTIAQTRLWALTRNGPAKGWIPGHFGLFSCRLDYLATPCKPFVGTVRDKRTGKPIAGITVGVCQHTISETKTDSEGRYRILGAGKSKDYEIDAGGMPYFNHANRHVADTPGLEPITVNFELERGIVVRGRLTDKSTGKPVQGEVNYKAAPDNPHVKDYADAKNGAGVAIDLQGRTKADGSFAVLTIPGPGLLYVKADNETHFVRGETKGDALANHAEIRIDPSESDPQSTICNIALEPGRELKGSVVGPDGKPLAGVYAAGRWPIFSHGLLNQEKLVSDTFLVGGMKPGCPRTLVFFHPEKKLGKVVKLQGDEAKSLVVRLAPMDAALTGRILDAKGRPWPGLTVSAGTLLGRGVFRDESYPPEFLWGYTAWMNMKVGGKATTDGEGRFRIAGLMPDLKYHLYVREKNAPEGTPPVYDEDNLIVAIDPGKTKYLGDLKSKRTPEK